jgi:hypothetical protein
VLVTADRVVVEIIVGRLCETAYYLHDSEACVDESPIRNDSEINRDRDSQKAKSEVSQEETKITKAFTLDRPFFVSFVISCSESALPGQLYSLRHLRWWCVDAAVALAVTKVKH